MTDRHHSSSILLAAILSLLLATAAVALAPSLATAAVHASYKSRPLANQCALTPCPYGNNDCKDPSCSRCNGTNGFGGFCAPGYQCLHSCRANTDCDQTSICSECWTQRCSAKCGGKCDSAKHCLAPGCNACVEGTCQLWSCGTKCSNSGDCRWGSCIHCDGNVCVAACGAKCYQNSDCGAEGCKYCHNNTCRA